MMKHAVVAVSLCDIVHSTVSTVCIQVVSDPPIFSFDLTSVSTWTGLASGSSVSDFTLCDVASSCAWAWGGCGLTSTMKFSPQRNTKSCMR